MTWSINVLYALDLGASILQVNLITTIWSTMGILLQVPFGILSDRLGRKPMLLYPTFVGFMGSLIRAFAGDPNHLLLAAFVGGTAGGGFFPVLLSMVADVTSTREEQKKAIGTLYLFSSVGMLLGPILCTILLTLPGIGLRNIYQFDAVAQAIVTVYVFVMVKETRSPVGKSEKTSYTANIKDLIRVKDYQRLLSMALLYFFFFSTMGTYIPIYSRQNLGLSDPEIASFSTYRSLAILLVRFLSAPLLSRVSAKSFLMFALVLGGVAGLATPLATNYLLVVLVTFSYGLSFGAAAFLGPILVAANSTSRNRGIANSVYSLFQSAGNFTTVVTSPLATALGVASVFLVGGVAAIVSSVPIRSCKDERGGSSQN